MSRMKNYGMIVAAYLMAFVTVQKVTDVRGRGFTLGKENKVIS